MILKIASLHLRASKALSLFMVLAGLAILSGSCEEEGPNIQLEPPEEDESPIDSTDLTDSTKSSDSVSRSDSIVKSLLRDTTYKASKGRSRQDKNILIEDFTGVRCNNCPKATDKIKSLKKDYGERVIALGIHSNINFSRPYDKSKENYRIQKGQSLYEEFGKPPQPAGMIDRFQFQGESGPILDYQKWKSKGPERLNSPAKANVYIKKFVEDNNQVTINVTVYFHEALNENINLTLAITEDNIIDYQLTPQEKVSDYEHDYVLRKILTPYLGERISGGPEAQTVISKGFQFSIEDNWKLENLNAVAFVHKSQPQHTVLQVEKIGI